MIVKCVKLLNRDGTPRDGERDSWLTIGASYYVLEICRSNDCIKYRLVGDSSLTPALHEAEKFEIVSNRIPDGWVFQLYGRADWAIGPKAWSAIGFWESFFDQDETAEAIFLQEFRRLAEANAPDTYREILDQRGILLPSSSLLALRRDDALHAITLMRDAGIAISGGEVYLQRDGGIEAADGRWHTDKTRGESQILYLHRSWATAENYIKAYFHTEDGESLFLLLTG
jgi:Immunity protein 40